MSRKFKKRKGMHSRNGRNGHHYGFSDPWTEDPLRGDPWSGDSSLDNECADDIMNVGRMMNVTNVTNVTNNVTNVYGYKPRERQYGNGQRRHGKTERKRYPKRVRRPKEPKLLRYCKTFGLVDSDKVLRMDEGELASEALNVMDYAARDMGKSIEGIGNSAVELAGSVVGIAGLAVKAAWGLGRMVMSIFD